jgi:hypothetical protein
VLDALEHDFALQQVPHMALCLLLACLPLLQYLRD